MTRMLPQMSNRVRKGSISGEAHGERREALEAHLHVADDRREELEPPQGNQHARGSNPGRTHQLLSLLDACSYCRPPAHEHRQGALLEQLRQRQ